MLSIAIYTKFTSALPPRFARGACFLPAIRRMSTTQSAVWDLNGGIHDAMELVDTLHRVITRQSSEALLDRYTRRRRTMNIEFVQEQTIINKKRLEEREPKARQARFDELRALADDPHQAQGILAAHLTDRQRAQGTDHRLVKRIHDQPRQQHPFYVRSLSSKRRLRSPARRKIIGVFVASKKPWVIGSSGARIDISFTLRASTIKTLARLKRLKGWTIGAQLSSWLAKWQIFFHSHAMKASFKRGRPVFHARLPPSRGF